MAVTDEDVAKVRRRQPSLPSSISNDVIKTYLEDADLEMARFGVTSSDAIFEKLRYLYSMHLMTVVGLVKDVTSESVKDVSASYATGALKDGETFYYQEFRKTLRRHKFPMFILKNS